MKQTILFSLLALAITTCANAQHIQISQTGPRIAITNTAPQTLIGLHLMGPQKEGYTLVEQEHAIAAGETYERVLMRGYAARYAVDGALFSDGHIEGPDAWKIGEHKAMREAIARGGPAYYDSKNMGESGTSYEWAKHFAQEYHDQTGLDAVLIAKPEPDAGGCPGCPTKGGPVPPKVPQITGWVTIADDNGDTYVPGASCGIIDDFPISGSSCIGQGQCTNSNPNQYMPGKTGVFAGVEVFGSCTVGYATIQANEVNSPPPGSGWQTYYVANAYATSTTAPPGNAYVIDSCIAPQQQGGTGLAPCE
jgi:hypothetical protein